MNFFHCLGQNCLGMVMFRTRSPSLPLFCPCVFFIEISVYCSSYSAWLIHNSSEYHFKSLKRSGTQTSICTIALYYRVGSGDFACHLQEAWVELLYFSLLRNCTSDHGSGPSSWESSSRKLSLRSCPLTNSQAKRFLSAVTMMFLVFIWTFLFFSIYKCTTVSITFLTSVTQLLSVSFLVATTRVFGYTVNIIGICL